MNYLENINLCHKFIIMKITYYILLLSSLLCIQRGEIDSIEFLESKTIEEVQLEIDQQLAGSGINITAQYNISLYKIVYGTIDGYGDSTLASGVIAIPDDPNNAFGIISWQHGTVVNRNSVSSVQGFNILSMIMSSTGYVYTEPDYLGLGVSEGFHPYCINTPSADAVVDMIRATRNFCNDSNSIQLNNQLSLVGYSEGGYATLAAQKMMEQSYADEFDITISFPMAGPYDLSGTMVDVMLSNHLYGKPYYLPYVLLAYIEYYDLGELGDFFLPEYAEILPILFDGYHSDGDIDEQLPNPPIQILLPELIEQFQNDPDHFLRNYLEENDLINWAPQSLTYLFHGLGDELIPFQNAQIAYDSFIENGSDPENIGLVSIPESYGGHSEAAPFALITAYQLGLTLQSINPQGDVNSDEQIDISDVVIIVDYIMSSIELDNYLTWASDMNGDSILDILDLIELIIKIFN